MKNNLSYLKNENFETILNDVHQEMVQKMRRQSKARQAGQIQNILMEIKKIAKNIDNQNNNQVILNNIDKQLLQLINNTFDEQLQVHSILRKASALFYRSHKISHIKDVDDIFEEELAYLIKAAAKMRGFNINIENIIGGKNKSSSLALNKISDNITNQVLDIVNKAIDNQIEDIEKKSKMKQYKISTKKSGKIDIYSPSFEINADIKDPIDKLLKAFSGATFSLKNYSSYAGDGNSKNLSDIKIHLGKSNIYKSITGSLSEILTDPRSQKSIFYRGMQILSGETKNSPTATPEYVSKHFAHLRFIYELRGSGLLDQTGNKQIADFIIWNDPNSEKIIVRSTADLIYRYIDDYSNAFSPVSISAAKIFANQTKK